MAEEPDLLLPRTRPRARRAAPGLTIEDQNLQLPAPAAPAAPSPDAWYEAAKAGTRAPRAPVSIGRDAGDAWYESAKPKTFGDAFSEAGAEQLPFVGMFVEGGRALELYAAAKRAEAGADLSPEDQTLLRDFFAQKDKATTWGYQVGTILRDLPAYGLEFWAGGAAARGVARGGMKLAGKAVREAVERASARMAEGAVSRLALKAAGTVAESAAVTAAMPGRVMGEGVRRALADTFHLQEDDTGEVYLGLEGSLPDFVNTVGDGAVSMWVENLSEYTGGAINKIPGVQQAALLQMALIRKFVPPGERRAFLRKIAQGTRWNGIIGEWGEERVADAMHTLVQGDPYKWPDLDQATAELVAFAVPGATVAAGGALAQRGQRTRLSGPEGTPPSGPDAAPTPRGPVIQPAEPTGEGPAPAPAVVDPEPAETAGTPPPRPPPPSTPEEAVRGLLAANVRAGAITQEEADAAELVEPPTPEAARLSEKSKALGQTPVWVRAAKDLPLEAAYGNRIIALDARAPLRKQVSGVFYEEWLHALRDQGRTEWDQLASDFEAAVPGLRDLYHERYRELATSRNLPVTEDVLEDEAVANIAEDLAGFVDFVFKDPKRAVRLASGNPGLWRKAVDTFIETVNRVFGTDIPTHLRRDLAELQAAIARTPLEQAIDPRVAIRMSLRVKEAIDSLLHRDLEAPESPKKDRSGDTSGPPAEAAELPQAPPQTSAAAPEPEEDVEPLFKPGELEAIREKGKGILETIEAEAARLGVPIVTDPAEIQALKKKYGPPSRWALKGQGIFGPTVPELYIDDETGKDIALVPRSPQKPLEKGGEPSTEKPAAEPRKGRIVPRRGPGGSVVYTAEPIEEEPRPPQVAPEIPPAARTDARVLAVNMLADSFEQGEDLSSMPKVVKVLAAAGYPTRRSKELDELVEQATVIAARRIVEAGQSVERTWDRLQKLYQSQPKLEERTSESRTRQAYSTPAPLAYLASRLARVRAGATVFEPTAGHGMLLMQADPATVTANEIDPARAAFLRDLIGGHLGGKVTEKDAASEPSQGKKFDVVIANPPFGKVLNEGGAVRQFDAGRFHTSQIDHAIAIRSLSSMKDNGRAVLILGSKKPFGAHNIEQRRADLYNTQESRAFFKTIFDDYNVVAHFTVAGELYDRQGAAWPIDVLVIEGRGKSALPLPGVQAPPIYTTYDELSHIARMGTAALRRSDRGGVPVADVEGGKPVELEAGTRAAGGADGGERGAAVPGDSEGGVPGSTGAPAVPGGRAGRAPVQHRRGRGRPERAVAGGGEPAPAVGAAGGAVGDRGGDVADVADAGAPGTGADLNAVFDEELEQAFQAPPVEEAKEPAPPKSVEDELRDGFNQLFSIEAYHGTPHAFDRFSTKFIGEGEGNQVYGWGLYFAGERKVAEHYRDSLSAGNYPRVTDAEGKELSLVDALRAYFGPPGSVIASTYGHDRIVEFVAPENLPHSWSVRVRAVQKSATGWVDVPGENNRAHSTFPDLNRFWMVMEAKGFTLRRGYIHQVRLAPTAEEWLDWDKYLDRQSEGVRAGVLKVLEELHAARTKMGLPGLELPPREEAIPARDLYRQMLETWYGARGASKLLLKHGIRGIRYLDELSRGTFEGILVGVFQEGQFWRAKIKVPDRDGTSHFTTSVPFNTEEGAREWAEKVTRKATYNFVVFDDADIEHVGRYSIERPPGFDEETYARAVPLFEKALGELKADRADPRSVIKAILAYARDTLKLAADKIRRMRDYVVVFAQEAAAGAQRQAEAPKEKAALLEPANAFQKPYEKRSSAGSLDTLVPTNMQTAISEALDALEGRVGDIDDYVAKHIGVPRDALVGIRNERGSLGGEQMDALALAIDNVERGAGFIIGDQTGVGKGRFVAGMMLYAERKGWVPIFVTQQPGLYGDIHRDLYALGRTKFTPLVTNRDLAGKKVIPLPAMPGTSEAEGDRKLKSLPPGKLEESLAHVIRTGRLPAGFDALFTTYAQMNMDQGKELARHKALRSASRNALLILDESHEAGGSEAKGWTKNGEPIPKRADYVRELLKVAKGAIYSSATFAKNPFVMTLYFRTDMALAVENLDQLVQSVKQGGVPLQQVVSSMLAKSGQYVRREKNMDGIELPGVVVKTNLELADDVARLTRAIFEFDTGHMKAIRNEFAKGLRKSGEAAGTDTAVGEGSVTSTSFASLLHNVTRQSLLALKARAAVDEAIREWKSGKKVLIGLADTFGAMLDDYVNETGVRVGDALPEFSFNRVFLRYLDRTRRITVTDAYKNKKHVHISDKDLAEMGAAGVVDVFEALRASIKESDLGELPSSPIDFILHELEKAGIKVGEITGREQRIDYGGGKSPVLRRRDNSGGTKKKTITAFQAGGLDALILNQSGATGYSMHADEKAKDQRVRHMAIAQAEANIDTFMQLLGRINRTGQVKLPTYALLIADIPAEKRPAAALLRKMASLNANVSAKREGAFTVEGGTDYMNQVGDAVVSSILREDRGLAELLDVDPDAEEIAGLASQATGRAVILSVEEQGNLLEKIEASYKSRLEALEAMGESPLEAKVFELDAKTLRAQAVTPDKGGESPFAKPAMMEEVDVKRLDKPVTWEQLWTILAKEHGEGFTEQDARARAAVVNTKTAALMDPIRAEWAKVQAKQQDRINELVEEAEAIRDAEKRKRADADVVRARSRLETIENGAQDLARLIGRVAVPGAAVKLSVGEGDEVQRVDGVVSHVVKRGKAKSPLSASDYEIVIYTTESKKPLSISALHALEGGSGLTESGLGEAEAAFRSGADRAREKRFMLTGNLLAGFARFGSGGRIVIFTDDQGRTREGILMRRSFNPAEAAESAPTNIPPAKVAQFLDQVGPSEEPSVETDDGGLQIRTDSREYELRAMNRGGRPYYLSPKVVRLIGNFTQRRGDPFWVATVPDHQTMRKVVAIYRETLGSNFLALVRKDLARQLSGIPELKFSIDPQPDALDRIRKFFRQAKKKGEATELGREPSDTAVQSPDADVRAFHRAVREERATEQEVISRDVQRARARRELARDPVGVKRTILLKVDADEALSAWETQAADILKEQGTIAALQDGNPEAYAEAVRLNWAYQDARRETARALGVIRDPLRAAARTGRQMLADLVTIPSADVREKTERLKARKRAPGTPEDVRRELEQKIKDLLMQEGARVADAKKKLIKAGFDPKLLTADYFKDPITFGRIARAVHDAKNPAGPWDWFLEWRLAAMLSGPLTQVANITGNFAHMVYDQHVRRLAEALANSVVRDPTSATWGEVVAFYRAFLPALARASTYLVGAYRTELPVFELDMQMKGVPGAGGRTKAELRGPAIPGAFGRVARAPSLTTLLAFDEFFKGLVATMEASALAYRAARAEGKQGEQLTERMLQILEDPTSDIQTQSLLKARRATFQAGDSALTNVVLQFRHFLNDSIGKPYLAGLPLGHLILPFVRTPIAIFKAGLFAANPFYGLAIPYRFFRGRYRHGNQAALVRDAAQAAVNLGVSMVILNMVLGSSGDDDDVLPLITGTPEKQGGARDLQGRTVPAYSIRVGGAWYSYRRVEPMAVTTATLVDLANDFIRASNKGTQEAAAAAAGRFFSSVAEQASDKTFLQTLGDIYQAVTERSEGTAVRILRDTLVTPMVPNIIRQPARQLDPEIRANLVRTYEDRGIWDAAARSLPYYMLPLQANAPPARYDLWGRPMTRADAASGAIARLFSPAPRSASPEKILDVDRMLLRYNARVERGDFGPDVEPFVARAPAYWYEEKGVTRYWNDEEYAELTREAGQAALARLERRRLNTENPTPKDIDVVTDAIADARKRVRARMKRAHPPAPAAR